MHTITSLRQISQERYEILFDDGGKCLTSFTVVADYGLYTGRELTEEEVAAVLSASSLARCKERAMRLIGLRPLSEREIYDKLVEKGESESNAAASVAWLLDLHLLNDADYAAMLVRHYAAKGYGSRRVRDELYRHKVPKKLWDDAMAEMPEADEKIDRLLRARLKSETPDRAELKKATDALLRRGYGWDEIRSAVARYQSEIEDYD